MCLCFLNWPPFFWCHLAVWNLGKMVTTIGWEPAKIPESQWKLKRTLEKNIFVYAMFMNNVMNMLRFVNEFHLASHIILLVWTLEKRWESWVLIHFASFGGKRDTNICRTFDMSTSKMFQLVSWPCLGKGVQNAFYEFHVPVALHMK